MTRSDRLRFVGWIVLAFGLVAAAALYVVQSRSADPALDDTTALGYTRSFQHEMGVMMGHFGEMLTEWQQALTSPIGEALVLAACAAIVAGLFFRVAWVLEQDGRG